MLAPNWRVNPRQFTGLLLHDLRQGCKDTWSYRWWFVVIVLSPAAVLFLAGFFVHPYEMVYRAYTESGFEQALRAYALYLEMYFRNFDTFGAFMLEGIVLTAVALS